MSVKQNAMDFASKYPLAAKTVDKSLYVDDCFASADTVEEAVELQVELQDLSMRQSFYSGSGIPPTPVCLHMSLPI